MTGTSTPLHHPTPFYSQEELSLLTPAQIPRHVAIIMDGNRRWAQERSLPASVGHLRGAVALTHIVRAASELGIRALTVFAFSTENWLRPKEEVEALLHLIKIYLIKEREGMQQEGVRLCTIGDLTPFPDDLKAEISHTLEKTQNGTTIDLILALNYGAKDEIKRAVQSIVKECMLGALDPLQITTETIRSYLDTAPWGDPELIIRTSGVSRLSNFLLWQASYAEVLVLDVLWPDFTAQDLLQSIVEYQTTERRNGL